MRIVKTQVGGVSTSYLILAAIIGILLMAQSTPAAGWPVWPDSSWHDISATYGLPQGTESGYIYMHPGVDFHVPAATPVYAINSGYVKAFITLPDAANPNAMWRIVVGNTEGSGNCDGYMYAHLDYFTAFTIAGIRVGQWVDEGQYLGDVVDFHDPSVPNHLHMSIINYAGDSAQWAGNFYSWIYTGNPLDSIAPMDDITPPVIENAYGNQLLAFFNPTLTGYFGEGEPISGDVDIIARIYDNNYFTSWKNTPYEVLYKIEGNSSIPWTSSVCFNKRFGTYDSIYVIAPVVYQYDAICNTQYIWNIKQEYYYNLTNTDNDSLIEVSDYAGCWKTPYFQNGEYKVFVKALDKAGNSAVDSMTVTVANYFELGGTIDLADDNPNLAGTIITAIENGAADTTVSDGSYSIPNVGGAVQIIRISRSGYFTRDTTLFMIENGTLNLELEAKPYICGDVNADETVNLIDILYLIDYKYGTPPGPAPQPEEAGDVNNDGSINLIDILYVIDYKYGTPPGPEPNCG